MDTCYRPRADADDGRLRCGRSRAPGRSPLRGSPTRGTNRDNPQDRPSANRKRGGLPVPSRARPWTTAHGARRSIGKSLGLSEMRLYTNKDFATNVRLYLGLGYQVDREVPFMGSTTVYMRKSLGSIAPDAVSTQG